MYRYLWFLLVLFSIHSVAATERYDHFPQRLRTQAREFEVDWNAYKDAVNDPVPVDNVLRQYVQDVLERDVEDRNFLRDVRLEPLIPQMLVDTRTAFWTPNIVGLMKREGNALSQYFLGFFYHQGVGPLEGDFHAVTLLQASAEQFYPRANQYLLGILPAAERSPIQERLNRVTAPEEFVVDYVREHPRPRQMTPEAVDMLLSEEHLRYLPKYPLMYIETHEDLVALLSEAVKRYRPSYKIRTALTILGAAAGWMASFIDALDKFVGDENPTTVISGNTSVIAPVDSLPSRIVGQAQIIGLGAGAFCGALAGFIVEGPICGYTLPLNMKNENIENHAGMIAAYLTLKHKDALSPLTDREARANFWTIRVKRYARAIADNFYNHRHIRAYGLSQILEHAADTLD